MRKLSIAAALIALLAVAGLLLQQRLELKRMAAENTDLRNQLTQIASLQDTNAQLAERLKVALETFQATQNEVTRLRGQGSRLRQLEQENTQLRAQRQELDRDIRQPQPAAVATAQLPTPVPATTLTDLPTTDLGTLELAEGVTARFDLGGGTNCVVTPTLQADGKVMMQIQSQITNADGTTSELATSRITARPGQHCSISLGDRMIALGVKLK
jgi:hypothetical protein